MPSLFIFLLLTCSMVHSQELRKLESIHSLKFGMKKSEIISQIKKLTDSKISTTERNLHSVLSISMKDNSNFNQLRTFLSKDGGLFAIEEEIFIRWNHQIEDGENLLANKKAMESVLSRLRSNYGEEDLLEETVLNNRESKFRHATASWKFADKRWIHVIYEPQDWTLYPELIKIIIIYRSSILDPRKN